MLCVHTRSVIGELSQGKQTQFTGPRLCLQVTYPDRHFMQIVDPIPEEARILEGIGTTICI